MSFSNKISPSPPNLHSYLRPRIVSYSYHHNTGFLFGASSWQGNHSILFLNDIPQVVLLILIHHPTAPIPQGTCTWQSPAQPLPSSLQSGLPLTACLQLKRPSAVLEGHIYNHRIERHWPLVKHVRLFSHQYCVYDSPLVSTFVTHPCHDVVSCSRRMATLWSQVKPIIMLSIWGC